MESQVCKVPISAREAYVLEELGCSDIYYHWATRGCYFSPCQLVDHLPSLGGRMDEVN